MPIKGSLEEASTHDVLQLLSLGRKTGCLSITNWASLGHIYVSSGRVIHATIVNRRDRLGDVLVRRGRITQEELDKAIRQQDHDRDKKLGEILMEMGAIKREELERHMRLQIEEAVYFLLGWREGNFTFEVGVEPPPNEFLISIEPESLMLEGARRTDEWPRIEKKVPSFGIVFKVDEERLASSDKKLTAEQDRIVALLDGSRDVGEIVDETGLPEFDVAKAVYGLVTAGLAGQVERRNSDRRLSLAGVRLDDIPEPAPQADATQQHLNQTQMADYIARNGIYADAKQRREAAFHICDCVSCSKLLKELHRKSTAEHKAVPDPQAEQVPPEDRVRRSGERRTGIDRRGSDAVEAETGEDRKARPTTGVARGTSAGNATPERRTGIDRRETDRRERTTAAVVRSPGLKGGAQAASGSSAQAMVDRRMATDRRSWVERRAGERRQGDRRRGTPVDRKDKFSVERRDRGERRQGDRRVGPRRATDRILMPLGQGSSAVPARGGTAAPAVAVPAPAPRRAPRRSTAPERRRTRPQAQPKGAEGAKGAKDYRPNLRLTEAEQQSLEGLPLIEVPKLAKPGTPRTSFPPPNARSKQQEFVAELTAAPPKPVVAESQPARAHRGRVAVIGAVAIVAVTLGWFGRPVMQSVFGGEESVVTVEEGGQVELPAVASAATLQPDQDAEAAPAADSQAPQQALPAEQTQPPPVQAEAPPRVRPAPVVTPPAAEAVPLPSLAGTVRSARSGAPLSGVRVAVQGTDLAVTTDATGSFEIAGVPAGSFSVRLSLDGYLATREQVDLSDGSEAQLDLSLESAPAAREPDADLGDGQWTITDHAGAEEVLGRPLTVVGGLWIESIARPAEGARPRVRVAQLTPSGERVVLTVTVAGPPSSQAPAQVTAIRVRPASDATSMTMGTASFGNLLVSARTLLPADSLRVQLQRLRESYDAEERR